MGLINYGILGNVCKECAKSDESDERIYSKRAVNEILNEALELIGRQHEVGEICDCECEQAKMVLEFLGNRCAFCDNKQALIYNEILPYIKKENPLKEKGKKHLVTKTIKGEGAKVIYPASFKKK